MHPKLYLINPRPTFITPAFLIRKHKLMVRKYSNSRRACATSVSHPHSSRLTAAASQIKYLQPSELDVHGVCSRETRLSFF